MPGGVDLQDVGMRLKSHITQGQVSMHTAHAAHTAHTQHTHDTHTHTQNDVNRAIGNAKEVLDEGTYNRVSFDIESRARSCLFSYHGNWYVQSHIRHAHNNTNTHTHSDVVMGNLSIIQNKPGAFVSSQWPHQDGRRAGLLRPDHLEFLRETEGVGSLMVADSDGCGVKFDLEKVMLNRGDMLFWLPWVRHCGECFFTWLFAGLKSCRCFLGLPYPKVGVESESRLFRRLHAHWHLHGREDMDDTEGIHCQEVRAHTKTHAHKHTNTHTHTHTRARAHLALSGLSCLGVCRFVLHPTGMSELQ
jgi:hypothetical protein